MVLGVMEARSENATKEQSWTKGLKVSAHPLMEMVNPKNRVISWKQIGLHFLRSMGEHQVHYYTAPKNE